MGERTDVHLDASSGAGEVFLVFLKLGLTSFGGPGRASRLLPRGVCGAAQAGWTSAPTPISSRSASSCPVRPAARSAWRSGCRARATWGRSRPGLASPCRRPWHWWCSPGVARSAAPMERLAAWSQGRRRGGRRASGARHDALARARQGTGDAGGCGCGDRARLPFRLGTGRCDRTRRSCRHHAVAYHSTLGSRLPAAGRKPHCRCCGLDPVLCAADRAAAAGDRRRPISHWPSFDAFYRAGSLVFGGGHVVLPLLQAEVVPPAG